jgi:hypothetical protein
MAYLVYNYDETDTLFEIANACGITVAELARINNIQEPYNPRPYYIPYLRGSILVPDLRSGGESFENADRKNNDVFQERTYTPSPKPKGNQIGNIGDVGKWSRDKCYIIIGGAQYYFPCFPESYTDTHNVNVTNQHPMGRSEPFQIYQNTGPREVSVSFRMHREMAAFYAVGDSVQYSDVTSLVAAVQSAIYPNNLAYPIIPKVTLVLGNSCYIEGIITSSVNVEWSETIGKDARYNVCNLSFSVTECTGNPKTGTTVAALNAR